MTETEKLVGGIADGLDVPAFDARYFYAGRFGDGFVNVYLRDDGRLRFYWRCRRNDLHCSIWGPLPLGEPR